MSACNLAELPWQAPGFHLRVQALAAGFGRQFGLPPVHQLGVMVPDADAAATELEQLGMERFFVAGDREAR